MKVVIVAGGLATRMMPVTGAIPKCLVDINGKPLIQHQLELFKKQGFSDFVFCVAHLAEKVKAYFKDGRDYGVNIDYVQETGGLLGTAGSVKLAERFIDDEDFIVYYGDNLTSMDFNKLLSFHKEKKGIASIVMRPLSEGYMSSSVITLYDDYQVKEFIERPCSGESETSWDAKKYINSGIYSLNRRVFNFIPRGVKYDFAKQLFPSLIRNKLGVFGYVTGEYFREIGRIDKYGKFLKEVSGRKRIL